MRTKLMVGAAVLAAGLVSTTAQVYSLNIVGYCNVPVNKGYSFLSNPLDNGDNSAATLFPNPNPTQADPPNGGPWDGSNIQEWDGVKWTVSVFDSLTDDTTTGFTRPGVGACPAPVIGSGKSFLFFNGGSSNLVTFVGQVRQGSGGYTNQMSLPTSTFHYALGSMLPLSGGPITALGFSNPNPTQADPPNGGPLDGCDIQVLNVDPSSGQALNYSVYVFDSLTDDTTTGFTKPGVGAVPQPIIPIAGGFFFTKPSSGTYTWTQTLTP